MSDLAATLRIVAKHLNACADELSGEQPEPIEPEPPVDPIAEAKAKQRERHKTLGK